MTPEQVKRWADGIQDGTITPDDIPVGLARQMVQEELIQRTSRKSPLRSSDKPGKPPR